ncbi:MAG: DNA replication/repair protein RecF [Actinobacteria bacterium]|nr:DNA replication/repair protein RecF [Actinomycetota bacterium]
MLLQRIELVDIRSYEHAVVEFGPGVTVVLGPNAHGKTNLLEAAYRLATGGSHRVTSDLPLVRRDAPSGVIRAGLTTDEGRQRSVELEVRPGRGPRVRVDGQDVRRASDALGVLRVVLFAPEDLAIIRGDPGDRRRFLDDLLAQRRPAYGAARGDFERVLHQRNRLLRTMRTTGAADDGTLAVWTEHLVRSGATLTAARIAAVHALAGPTSAFYDDLADRPEPVQLRYRSSAGMTVTGVTGASVEHPEQIAQRLRDAFAAVAAEESARGLTLVGPHRDDLDLSVGELPARGYASQGQMWSLALALRLATFDVLAEVGDRPVVLLDDVFAELDDRRRTRLAERCATWEQVIVTAASEVDVPVAGARLDVRAVDGASTVSARGEVAG